MKKNKLFAMIPFLFVAPTLVSCAGTPNKNNSAPSTDKDNSNSSSNQQKPNVQPIFEELINKLDGSSFIEKEKHPEFFQSQHYYSLANIEGKTALELIQGTPTYKTSLNNLYNYAKNNIDFTTVVEEGKINKYNSMFEETGLIGEIGKNEVERIMFSPIEYDNVNYMKPKYLSESNLKSNFVYEKKASIFSENEKNKINKLINKNPFGYLPSNLNQLLYYLKISDIENIFNVRNVNEVLATHDDEKGEIVIFFNFKDNTNKVIVLDKTNSNLKNNNDFYQYIFDRTFMTEASLWSFENKSSLNVKGKILKRKAQTGTVWFVDRIINEELRKKDTYEFLVATNQHVLDFSNTFSKNYGYSGNQYYDKYWDAGFTDVKNGDEKETISDNSTTYETFTYKKDYDTKTPIKMRFAVNKEKNVANIKETGDNESKDFEYNNSWTSENYTDLIWFTPIFSSSNIRAKNSSNNNMFFDEMKEIKTDGKTLQTGIAKYSGADFVLAKVQFTKSQIEKMFPALDKVLEKEEEKEWYVGVGNKEKIAANHSVFIGGYPSTANNEDENSKTPEWNTTRSNGGKIISKSRYLDKNNIITQWTKYHQKINEERNKRFETIDFYKEQFQPYYKGKDKQRTLTHGMKLTTVVQNSILNINSDKYLVGGASGSMVIDSKFNLVGAIYNGLSKDNANTFFTNGVSLLDSQSTYDDWNGSIRDSIVEKLKKEKLQTIKINPKIIS